MVKRPWRAVRPYGWVCFVLSVAALSMSTVLLAATGGL
jgi:hypothetical protein